MFKLFAPKFETKKSYARRAALARAVRWVVGPTALAALLIWVVGFRATADARVNPKTVRPAVAAPVAEPSYTASAIGAVDVASLSPAARAAAKRAADKEVAEKNQEAGKDKRAFAEGGWELVKTAPPDARVVGLDPALLNGREAELRVQVSSTVAAPAQTGKLAEIARRASDEQTRTVAVEALGRVGGSDAQHALFELLSADLPADDAARRAIVPLLRPTDLNEPYASELARTLDSSKVTPVERKQLAFTLALVGLRDGTELPAPALMGLTPSSRELLASMRALATTSHSR